MTWKVVTDKTQKILCRSAVRTALDPKLRNLSLDPLSTTDFQMSDATLPPPQKEYDPSSIPFEHVYFRNHGGTDDSSATSTTKDYKYKSVITDENGNPRKDANGEIMYRFGPHPEDLSGRCLIMTHFETGLATHITIGQLIDDYKKRLS